jgi:hypothetical protein
MAMAMELDVKVIDAAQSSLHPTAAPPLANGARFARIGAIIWGE